MKYLWKCVLCTSAIFIFFGVSNCIAQDANDKEKFLAFLKRTETPEEIESIIKQFANSDFVTEAIVKSERIITQNIKKNGVGNRFVFKEIQPAPKSLKGSATFKENREGGILMVTEFPGDTISISLPFSSGPPVKGEGSKWIPAVFTKLNDKIFPTQDIPGGDESIHRYTGIVPVGVNIDYIFSGEPGISDHLTFVLIKDIGYVYLRGTGVVFLLQEGKVVKAVRCIKGACEVVE